MGSLIDRFASWFYITRIWGSRCVTKDTEDFPDLISNEKNNRCPCCLAWEKHDEMFNKKGPSSN